MHETIYSGGTIRTMDRAHPVVEALLVRGNRIVATGTREELQRAVGADVTIVDLAGRTLIPGFNDSHLHVTQLGARERALDLSSLDLAGIIDAAKSEAVKLAPGEPLVGFNWDYPSCPNPHRLALDEHFADRPVLLIQFSGHGAWLNTKALELFRLDRSTPDWDIGGLVRDDEGELTGIVRELFRAPGARRIMNRAMRRGGPVRDDLVSAMKRLREHGITTAQDNTWFPWVVDAIAKLHRDGEQTCRLTCWSPGFMPPLDAWYSLKRFNPDWYALGPRKYFLDGAFSSHSAWLSEPYADVEGSGSGLPPEKVVRFIRRAERRGRQMACHAIGDAATTSYLDAMERVPHRRADSRHRIEHGQLIADRDIERIVKLGMVVSAQPHAAATPAKDVGLLGEERAARAYPYRALIDAGAHLAFGSDFPGEMTFDPLYGVHLTVNREIGSSISPEEALYCYTAGSAYAEFRENDKGMLRPGYLADLVVLSDDPVTVPPQKIREIRVDMTIVDGNLVYDRAVSPDAGTT